MNTLKHYNTCFYVGGSRLLSKEADPTNYRKTVFLYSALSVRRLLNTLVISINDHNLANNTVYNLNS